MDLFIIFIITHKLMHIEIKYPLDTLLCYSILNSIHADSHNFLHYILIPNDFTISFKL